MYFEYFLSCWRNGTISEEGNELEKAVELGMISSVQADEIKKIPYGTRI